MPRGRDTRRQQQSAARAAAKGECVFHALLSGVSDLLQVDKRQCQAHTNLLKTIRNKLRRKPSPLEAVRWNNHELSSEEVEEFTQVVLQHVHVGNGYFCGACDPLVAAYCAVFRFNVVHDFDGTLIEYTTPQARRTVHLESSSYHMEYVRSQDHLPDACTSSLPCGHETFETRRHKTSDAGQLIQGKSDEVRSFDTEDICDATLQYIKLLGVKGALRRQPSQTSSGCTGKWVLGEAPGHPITVGILRAAQGKSQIKILRGDGHVVFYPSQDSFLTSFEPDSPEKISVDDAALVLIRQRWSLLAGETSLIQLFQRIEHMLPVIDLLPASAASLPWLGMIRGCMHDSALRHHRELSGSAPPFHCPE